MYSHFRLQRRLIIHLIDFARGHQEHFDLCMTVKFIGKRNGAELSTENTINWPMHWEQAKLLNQSFSRICLSSEPGFTLSTILPMADILTD